MPYTRRNASPYVPSPSETDLKARNIGITESLTASNINTLNLSVLGNVNGVLNAPDGVSVNTTLKVPTRNTTPINPNITLGPLSAGLITIDKSNGKMYFSKDKDVGTPNGDSVSQSLVAIAAASTPTTLPTKLDAIRGQYDNSTGFVASIAKDYGVQQVYQAAAAAAPTAAIQASLDGATAAKDAVDKTTTTKQDALVAIDSLAANDTDFDAGVATVRFEVAKTADLPGAKGAAATVVTTKTDEADISAGSEADDLLSKFIHADNGFSPFEWVLSSA